MFNSKYLITFLNEKWEVVKELKLKSIPQKDEFVYFDNKYFRIVTIVHQLEPKTKIIAVIKEFSFSNQ